ncbi:hypothetical protein Tco_0356911 [Tanacetum coccineum]
MAYVERLVDNKRKACGTLPGTTRFSKQTRGKTPEGPMPQGMLTGDNTKDLDLGVLSVTITTTVLVLQDATSATDLVTYLVTADFPKNATFGANQGAMVVLNVVVYGTYQEGLSELKEQTTIRGNRDGNANGSTKGICCGKYRGKPETMSFRLRIVITPTASSIMITMFE